MQQQLDVLGIKKSALEIVAMIEFLFINKIDILIDNCLDKSEGYIHTFIYDYRKQMIKETRYASYFEFEDTYKNNKKEALARLFQEYMNDAKLAGLFCNDPMVIYNQHTADPEIRFNRFAMQFR
ncbi:hypothetical protein NSQ20_11940 [Paenibacillus sp. FSL K6-1122]|uniref:hypothetical protein n=1 Tax=Paenibacillus sp. FSL K6-1122 TaxID=2954512 RepID=UPI0030EE597B